MAQVWDPRETVQFSDHSVSFASPKALRVSLVPDSESKSAQWVESGHGAKGKDVQGDGKARHQRGV